MERMTVELSNALSDNGFCVKILVQDVSLASFYQLNNDIEISSLGSFSLWNLHSVLSIRKYVNEKKPDFLLNIGVPLSRLSLPALLGKDVKIITWEHFNLYAGSLLGFFWRLISAKLSYKTVVLTDEDRCQYSKYILANITTVYNFTTIEVVNRSDLKSNTVLSVGRLEPQKGYDRLLYAWAKLAQYYPDWTLKIVGSGSCLAALVSLSEELNISSSVIFVPATDAVSAYYQEASIYVMSSRFEGFGLVLIEAKMFGLPCVSFACKCGPREIIKSEIDGKVVKDGDVNALSEALSQLMGNRSCIQKYGDNAYKDAHVRFQLKSVIQDWVNIFSN